MQIRKTRQQSRGGDDALRALWVHLRFKLKFQFITTANITHTQSRYFDSCLLDLLAFLLFTCFSQFDQCANTKCLCCCCSLLSSDLARLCPSVPIKTWTCQQKFTHTHTHTNCFFCLTITLDRFSCSFSTSARHAFLDLAFVEADRACAITSYNCTKFWSR